MRKMPREPRIKTLEDLSREQTKRVELDLIRALRWRIRRQWYWLVTVGAGIILLACSLAVAEAIF